MLKAEKNATSDRVLLRRMQSGDSEALAGLFQKYARPVFAYAYSRLSSRLDAEDLVQETFATLWERRAAVRLVTESALPWLLTTARFKVMNARRSRLRSQSVPLDENDVATTADATAAAAEHAILLRYLDIAVAHLPAIDRQIYDLCVEGDMSYAHAARRLGLTHAALRGRLSRLRTRLRVELDLLRGGA